MILRRRSFALIALVSVSACSVRRTDSVRTTPVPAEALTDAATIRARCEDPEGVIAGRVLCVLKDLPHAPEESPSGT